MNAEETTTPPVEFQTSRGFTSWLKEVNAGLAFTTYRIGKIHLLGLKPDGGLSVFERTFGRAMGLCADGDSLYMSTDYQLWRFQAQRFPSDDVQGGYDCIYSPSVAWITGDLDIHDIAVNAQGRPVFANTLFSCLSTVSETASFAPIWVPEFISKLAAEDRCHLNGFAMKDDKPKWVTAVGTSDVADGWRDQRTDGGVVIDVQTNKTAVTGLSMPHSPRHWKDQLWLIDSGTGYLGMVDMDKGTFIPKTFLAGYARGLSFIGDYAVIGLSKCRQNRTFSDLKLEQNLQDKNAEARCGLMIVDTKTGDIVHSLRIEGLIDEIYDVAVLPKTRRPMAIGIKSDEIKRFVSIEDV